MHSTYFRVLQRLALLPFFYFSVTAYAAETETANQATRYEINPMDAETERLLNEGPLKSYVAPGFDHQQKQFRKNTVLAAKKIKPYIELKKHDPLEFVYDSLFYSEKDVIEKYSDLSPTKIKKAREVVIGTFHE